MNCLFYAACFLALLQSALAMPTLAPRADQVAASHKGQSDEKCYFGCGFSNYGLYGSPFGSSYLTNYMSPYFYGNNLYGGLNYNLAYNSYGSNFGIGANVGLFKKDASEANKHQENSA
ncbi:hypothetical protein PGTUg99_008908 [Puccinia graminis f. sp. tritici]|uniref:Uncharacterized protein n=1 Tax=Puccinia graminis f. sp. tritici TaxID=56615 RepID=A0A5B0MY78_PUCGR|nr:hypothetical protein PGTUg99_008908 [Puccinia graminis f. sp. tritici]